MLLIRLENGYIYYWGTFWGSLVELEIEAYQFNLQFFLAYNSQNFSIYLFFYGVLFG
jgi:hypothetical protein